jgi:hypothetical protein
MTANAFADPEGRKNSEARRQPLFAIFALILKRRERRRARTPKDRIFVLNKNFLCRCHA